MKIIQDCKACEKDSKTCQCICLDLAANQSQPVMIRVDLDAVDDESRAPINQFCLGCAEYNANQFPCSGSSDCVDDCYTPDPNLAAAPSPSVPAVESRPSTVSIQIDATVYSEFVYMCELASENGSPAGYTDPSQLIAYVLSSVANGSRRPGSWERRMLEMMGLVAYCNDHYEYRSSFGNPAPHHEEQSK